MTIGERIKLRRKELRLTLKEVVSSTGLSLGNLSELENDKYQPSIAALIPLSETLDCSIDWIVTGNNRITENMNVMNTASPNQNNSFPELSLEEQLLIQKFRAGVRPLLDEDIKRLTGDAGRLSDPELDLVLKFRAVDSRDQDDIMDIVNGKYRRSFSSAKSSTSQNGKGRADYDSGAKMA